MADPAAEVPLTTGAPDAQPTPLTNFAASLLQPPDYSRSTALMGERSKAADARSAATARGVERLREQSGEMSDLATEQRAEREAARPADLALPKAPSTEQRSFLETSPSASFLSQMHTLMLGVGQLAMQVRGLRGSGIAATVAMKGALEGWRLGDLQRVEREMAKWRADTTTLLHQHKAATDKFRMLVDDQKLTWDERFAAMTVEAKALQWDALAKASEVQDIDAVLKHVQHAETLRGQWAMRVGMMGMQLDARERQHEATLEVRREAIAARLQQAEERRAQARQFHDERLDMQREFHADRMKRDDQRIAQGDRRIDQGDRRVDQGDRRLDQADRRADQGDRRLDQTDTRLDDQRKLIEARVNALGLPRQVLQYAEKDLTLGNRLRELDRLEGAIDVLVKAGITPVGASIFDSAKTKLARQAAAGDPKIGEAVDVVNRIGTALIIGRELTLGATAGTMRLKSIAEAEAGNAIGITRDFWKNELPLYRQSLNEQRTLVQNYLGTFKKAKGLMDGIGGDHANDGFELLD